MSLPVAPGVIRWTTRFGDIEHSVSTEPTKVESPYISIIVTPSGTSTVENILLSLHDGLFKVSPVQWTPEEVEFSFISLSGKLISNVTGWRPSWNIELKYGGRGIREQLLHAATMMNGTKWTFLASSAVPDRKFLFYPAGDYGRVGIPVVMQPQEVTAEHFADRYLGYSGTKLTIMGEKLYSEMEFPPPVVVHSRGTWGSHLTDGCHVYCDPTTVHIP